MKLMGCLASAFLLAGSAHGLKLGQEGLHLSATEVMVSHRFTVSVELLDDTRAGAVTMETILLPDPAEIVRLTASQPPVSFGCAGPETIKGWWEFEAVAPGILTFQLDSSMFTCTQNIGLDTKAVSAPVSILPVPIWSAISLNPPFLAPGEETELKVVLRNDSREAATFLRPFADVDMLGPEGPLVVPSGPVSVTPAELLKDGRLVLPPGREVSIYWKFKARTPGRGAFRAIAAGLFIKSGQFTIRPAAGLRIEAPESNPTTAVGQDFDFRCLLRQSGGTGITEPFVSLSLSPDGMARLQPASLSSTAPLGPERDMAEAVFRLEALKPGSLVLTLTAGGREEDSGRPVSAAAVKRTVRIQPPTRIFLRLETVSNTVLAGSKTAIRIVAENRSTAPAQGMTPVVSVRKGRASIKPLSPIFQGVPAGGTVFFTGAIVTSGEGEVELLVQATTRSDRGGEWTTVQSSPVKLKSIIAPRFTITSLKDRAYTGATETLKFRLTNASSWPVRLNPPAISLNSVSVGSMSHAWLKKPATVTLAAGASATITVQAYLPTATVAYDVTAMVFATGAIMPFGLGFDSQTGNRPLVLACPPRAGLVRVEPSPVFRPPLDPVLLVEWTMTAPGSAGIAVMTADPGGRLVRTLDPLKSRRPGFGSVLWTGADDSGVPVPSGKYTITLAGPVSSTAGPDSWPAGAVWRRDLPIEIVVR